jgi:catalase
MWRHCKVLGAFGETGRRALDAAGVPDSAPGVLVGDDAGAPADLFAEVTELLTLHRVWDRFAPAGA